MVQGPAASKTTSEQGSDPAVRPFFSTWGGRKVPDEHNINHDPAKLCAHRQRCRCGGVGGTYPDRDMRDTSLIDDCTAAASARCYTFLAMLRPLGIRLDLQKIGKLLESPSLACIHLLGCLVV